MYTAISVSGSLRVRSVAMWMFRWCAVAEAIGFLAFFALASALFVGGGLGLDTIGVPAIVLAHSAAHPVIAPILVGIHADYLLLGVSMAATSALLWPLVLDGAPRFTFVALLFSLGAGGLFIGAGCIGLPQPVTVSRLALALDYSNWGAALYGVAVIALSYAAACNLRLPRLLVALGVVWGVVAIVSAPIPAVGALGPLLGAPWAVWLVVVLTGWGDRGRRWRNAAYRTDQAQSAE